MQNSGSQEESKENEAVWPARKRRAWRASNFSIAGPNREAWCDRNRFSSPRCVDITPLGLPVEPEV